MDFIGVIEHMIWPGFAAVGFAILFNVPRRTLIVTLGMGSVCGLVKYLTMNWGLEVITATFLSAIVVGFLSIPAAHNRHSPMYVFSIPSIISMIPGAFSYRAMLGLMKLTRELSYDQYVDVMQQTTSNGLKAVFVLLSIAVGVALPMLLTRHESARAIVQHIVKKQH